MAPVYTESVPNDVVLFAKAFLSNQLARFAPSIYVKLTRQTGRAEGHEDAKEIADYFLRCFGDYRDRLRMSDGEFDAYLRGKQVLEYGPGDVLAVALLLYAHGAEHVSCVDKFPLTNMSSKNLEVYRHLLNSLQGKARERADGAFNELGKPLSGFKPSAIAYHVTKDGLSGRAGAYDLVISRAVLEHVNSLEKTMLDVGRSLKPNGISLHEVDLRSHGLDRYVDFDFLTWPDAIYKLMYRHKGFPNRWRVDKYKDLAKRSGLEVSALSPTGQVERSAIDAIYPRLPKKFALDREELAWTGFWIELKHAS